MYATVAGHGDIKDILRNQPGYEGKWKKSGKF